jgi:uncharacterized protein Yka (UPF0111/DUF47 family)
MSFLARFLPQEDKFYHLMRAMSEKAEVGAVLLRDFASSTDEASRQKFSLAIIENKAASKALSQQMTKELAMSFVTPFDREDIQDLATNLYKIPKIIDKIRERLELHDMKNDDGYNQQLALIVQGAKEMQDVVDALTRKGATKVIVDKVAVMHDLESQGDDLLGQLQAALFRSNVDARELILRKDIYEMLEKVTDRYRDAAATALQIVLKHS